VLLYLLLTPFWVAAGLMFGNGISFVLAAAVGYILLRRRIGTLGLRRVFATLGRLGLAGVIAAVPTVLVLLGLTAWWGDGKGASVVQLIIGGAVLVAVYVGAAFALRVSEVRELWSMVRSRLGR
jgi:putative peptidoglycan lipid II flippase